MKKIIIMAAIILASSVSLTHAGFFDKILKKVPLVSSKETLKESLDDNTIISGLKEALTTSTDNAVKSVSKADGYFTNEAIKILMPPEIDKVAIVLRKAGFNQMVDDFILSMNRAAERAAPEAASIFMDSIKEMTFDDARGILKGGDTAATDYFRSKAFRPIQDAFTPIVSSAMDEVDVTRSYKKMIGMYSSIPFTGAVSMDLDEYVTKSAAEGLFYMLGEEEKKIRTDPAARGTELLKKVFGK